ncbi:UDP-N-acetylmuramoyl-tripeptide--D-alanyl-D-alanine ligase [Weissella koreensis]|uniref:UDP-N-acetylmuramoyl-tripeptide--D-alanyl-D- alanine ligase n=1 Tax=Weissella koreensis TaxID=165096 RepID=UPI0022BA3A93|nr:UDP-N-acetylmuramoyl-tripeptide--D-alanyl-D-alanine ligase [Weissella koreensis]MCZ9310836.1 UDP-N-acetylmuramoyl-tripeptide--D-alanyl-D-alanine ligase [Weissella koreensis]
MKYSLATIAQLVDGELLNSTSEPITEITFDGRTAKPGSLFIPITWGNDGHNFIQGAIDNGASATLWAADHGENQPSDFPIIIVQDTLKAFQQLAQAYLKEIEPKVIAVSGSNGKTTTKDFIATIASTMYRTVKTAKNFNNELGVPLTILSMPADTEVLVIELGMDHPHDLDSLSKLVTPDIAVLTMIGEAHIEFFKTRARIADGKMEIINGLKPNGVLVYNGDEPLLIERAANLNFQTKTFGLSTDNQLFASQITLTDQKANFTTNQMKEAFQIPLTGNYNVSNALAAISVGQLLKVPANLMKTALQGTIITENRTEWIAGNFGGQILSDVYNSNPTAVREVLKSFSAIKKHNRKFVVLGDMLELGTAGPELHASLATDVIDAKPDAIFLVGPLMQNLADKITNQDPQLTVHSFLEPEIDTLIKTLQAQLQTNDQILIKASHGLHLERIVQALTK